jgi:hypothetical protein
MATTPVHRPLGVGLLSILLIIGGILDIIGGIVLTVAHSDNDIRHALDVSSADLTTYGVVSIVLGVIVLLVGFALRRGASWARYLVAIIAAVRLATLIWAVIAYSNLNWYEAIWPAALYLFVAGYLFFDEDAKRYFAAMSG